MDRVSCGQSRELEGVGRQEGFSCPGNLLDAGSNTAFETLSLRPSLKYRV